MALWRLVSGGWKGGKPQHLQEEKGLLDGSEDIVLAWSSDEIFSASFFHLK